MVDDLMTLSLSGTMIRGTLIRGLNRPKNAKHSPRRPTASLRSKGKERTQRSPSYGPRTQCGPSEPPRTRGAISASLEGSPCGIVYFLQYSATSHPRFGEERQLLPPPYMYTAPPCVYKRGRRSLSYPSGLFSTLSTTHKSTHDLLSPDIGTCLNHLL